MRFHSKYSRRQTPLEKMEKTGVRVRFMTLSVLAAAMGRNRQSVWDKLRAADLIDARSAPADMALQNGVARVTEMNDNYRPGQIYYKNEWRVDALSNCFPGC